MKPKDLPRYEDFLWPTLEAVEQLGGSGTISEIDDRVMKASNITADALSVVYESSGVAIVPDRLSWARSYLKMAGLLDSGGRGIWTITEMGRVQRASGSEAELRRQVADAYNKRAQSYRERAQAKAKPLLQDETARPDPDDRGSPETANPSVSWDGRLISILAKMHPSAFERLCQRLLRESGFTKVEVTGKSSDGGIDGHGVLRVNLISFQVLFQAKRWQSAVGSSVVRDFRGAMVGRADKGLIITTSSFTREARAEATRDGAPAIDLIDGEDLCLLLRDNRIGIRIKMVEEVEVDEGFFLSI